MEQTIEELKGELKRKRLEVEMLESQLGIAEARAEEKAKLSEREPVVRWIPICEGYAGSSCVSVKTSLDGWYTTAGKRGFVKVLWWLQVLVDPADDNKPVRILEIVHRPSDAN